MEPGWIHELIAGVALKSLQAFAERNGVDISVGDIQAEDLKPSVITDDAEGPQPIDVASRVVAHVAHRIPGVRRIEKRLEGRDKRSGILSDMGALAAQLYSRNQELINQRASEIGSEIVTGIVNPKGSRRPVAPEDGIIDFGPVAPIDGSNGNNNGGN